MTQTQTSRHPRHHAGPALVANRPADDAGYFAGLPALVDAEATFDHANYRPAPDDWCLVVTDIENSTSAITAGLHKTVNFVAATGITALKNLCAPIAIPFLFGGDGAVVMVPAAYAEEARRVLARLRRFAASEFKLALRVSLVSVGDLRRFGADVLVGRYEPSPANSFGVFLGGGVDMLESAIKGSGSRELAALAAIPEALDDGELVDLSGLSCRWDELRSTRGKMVTLIISGARDPGEAYAAIMRIAGPDSDAQPARPETIMARWPPKGFMLEAHVRRGRRPLAVAAAEVLAETGLVRLLFARGKPLGRFSPRKYIEEIATNTDFCKHDDTLSFVIDCPPERIETVRAFLEGCSARGEFRYGMHLSDTALMTCIVTSPTDSLHVHFIDGGDGGYTTAAKSLKSLALTADEIPANE